MGTRIEQDRGLETKWDWKIEKIDSNLETRKKNVQQQKKNRKQENRRLLKNSVTEKGNEFFKH